MEIDFTSRGNGTWGWRPRRNEGIWKYGPRWAKPLVAGAPWITVCLLVLMFYGISGHFVSRPGTIFDLPSGTASADLHPEHVALMLSVPRETGGTETLVYFDDARYILSDESSVRQLQSRMAELAAAAARKELLLMCDRRVSHGEVMKFTDIARRAGVAMVQVAERGE